MELLILYVLVGILYLKWARGLWRRSHDEAALQKKIRESILGHRLKKKEPNKAP